MASGFDKLSTASKQSFEDAMSNTGFGKFNKISVAFVGFMLLGMISETLGLSYVIPVCHCDLKMTLTDKIWFSSIPFVAIIITSHMWGYLADTKGRKKILCFSMVVGSIVSIISSFSPNLYTFAVLRLICGLFISGPSALGYAYLGELNPISHRDKMITLGNASVILGTAFVPLLSWAVLPFDFNVNLWFINYRPWRLLVCIFALPYVVCAFVITKLPESPKFLYAQGKIQESLKTLSYIYSVNTGNNPSEYPVKDLKLEENDYMLKRSFCKSVWYQTAPIFRPKLRMYTFATCLIQFGIFATANGFYIWFPTILNDVLEHKDRGTDEGKNLCEMLGSPVINNSNSITVCDDTLNSGTFPISIGLSCFGSSVSVISAFMINIIGKRNMLFGFCAFAGTLCLIMHWIREVWSAIIILAMIQSCSTCSGLTNAFIIELFPTHIRAMAVSLALMIGRIGSMFGTNTIGYLLYNECPVSFFLFCGILFSLIALATILPKTDSKPKNKPPQPPLPP